MSRHYFRVSTQGFGYGSCLTCGEPFGPHVNDVPCSLFIDPNPPEGAIILTVVRLEDDSPAYRLPHGTLVTVEAWDSISDAWRRDIITDDERRGAG